MKRKIEEFTNDTKNSNPESEIRRKLFNGIETVVSRRGYCKSCCPSEIPRLFLKLSSWKSYMSLTREVSFEMARLGKIDILQKGIVISIDQLDFIKGPIRLRLKKN